MRQWLSLRQVLKFRNVRTLYYGPTRDKSLVTLIPRGLPHQSYQQPSSLLPSFQRHFRLAASLRSEVEVKVPPLAESISEGDIRWLKQVGESVAEDEAVAEIETDKTAVPVPAPCAGVITAQLIEDGEKVVPGQPIFNISTDAAAAAAAPKAEAAEPAPEAPPAPAAAPSAAPSAPPATDAPKVDAPKEIRPPPDLSALKVAAAAAPPPGSAVGAVRVPAGSSASQRGEQRIKMNRMRQRIAQRLKDSQNTCAMLTTFNEIDMSNLFELRAKYKEEFTKQHSVKLGFMSAFVKAAAYSLKKYSVVNAVIDGNEIVYRDYVDVSIAVATPKGLVVPVIRNVEKMNFADIEKTINALGEKARTGTLAIEDMDGGTFTISNGGVFGSMFGTPIINPPQSAILGMHGIFERPVAVKGQVVVKPMMYVALTYDHRLIDGREAVFFLRKIKSFVEDPRILLLDL